MTPEHVQALRAKLNALGDRAPDVIAYMMRELPGLLDALTVDAETIAQLRRDLEAERARVKILDDARESALCLLAEGVDAIGMRAAHDQAMKILHEARDASERGEK